MKSYKENLHNVKVASNYKVKGVKEKLRGQRLAVRDKLEILIEMQRKITILLQFKKVFRKTKDTKCAAMIHSRSS